jgi:G3E family GTPase
VKARYIMIGGFLGAGKTTAVLQLARHLTERGQKVGLITNDQSDGLVDSSILRSHGFSVEEIGGGCFCCRFDSLNEAVEQLTADTRPDVFIAEPVGSCTDLVATVSYPLRRIYGDSHAIAPLSVLVDPLRAARVLGLDDGRSFSPKVVYVYKKQLEEAELILINKCDQIDEAAQTRLEQALRSEFPRAEVLRCSAKDGAGLDSWFDRLLTKECTLRPSMPLDYGVYAEGEAKLGWLNCTLALETESPFDANELLLELTEGIRGHCRATGEEIAHLKMTLDSQQDDGQLAVISLVSTEGEADVRESLFDRVEGGSLIVNLRAEADSNDLKRMTEEVLAESLDRRSGLTWRMEHLEHFQPAPPTPTERITDPEQELAAK